MPDPMPHVIDYGTKPPRPRHSKLAVAALVTACMASPCLLSPLCDWINQFLPQRFRATGEYGRLQFWIRTTAMVFALGLSILARMRVKRARGMLLGDSATLLAVAISTLWWVLLLGLWLFWLVAAS